MPEGLFFNRSALPPIDVPEIKFGSSGARNRTDPQDRLQLFLPQIHVPGRCCGLQVQDFSKYAGPYRIRLRPSPSPELHPDQVEESPWLNKLASWLFCLGGRFTCNEGCFKHYILELCNIFIFQHPPQEKASYFLAYAFKGLGYCGYGRVD
jgi:hypothetical protein